MIAEMEERRKERRKMELELTEKLHSDDLQSLPVFQLSR
jgi:hypothetical protein